jgi:hypothetical protein
MSHICNKLSNVHQPEGIKLTCFSGEISLVDISLNTKVQNSNSTTVVVTMLYTTYFLSDLIDSSLDILTVDKKLLAFKEIKIIFTRYDFDQLFPVGLGYPKSVTIFLLHRIWV